MTYIAEDSLQTVGCFCISIFCASMLGVSAVGCGLLNGLRRYTPDIPLVGSCSAALSATRHRSPEDPLVSLRPLYGVL